MITIYWLRNDLRLHDNECLTKAIEGKKQVLMVYCFDPRQFEQLPVGFRKTGYLRYRFLCESLLDLRQSLIQKGSNIYLTMGLPEQVLPTLAEQYKASKIIFQKEIAQEEIDVEKALQEALASSACQLEAIWGKTLYHINDAPFKPQDTPITSKAFRLQLTKQAEVRPVFDTPEKIPNSVTLREWGIIPTPEILGFDAQEIATKHSSENYKGGENYGLQRLQTYTFDTEQLTAYRWTRNRSMGMEYSSKFSPWMALGCLSPRLIYEEVKKYEKLVKKNASTWWLIFEIVWRDYFKYTALRVGNSMFAEGGIKHREVEWQYDKILFQRWAEGKTGIPFVDAHMRELNATGFMSNRGRVNCASFLTRDYKIDWRWGAAWFEQQLLDYDVCSNWLNWNTQATEIWYTNPVHQGLKYDKKAEYIRTWLPELANIDDAAALAPWLLSPTQLKEANALQYPLPVEIYKKWTRSINNIKKASNLILDVE